MPETMSETEFKTIPDFVTPENRQRILELAVPNEPEVSQVECCEYLIRHWVETVEDGNPLYTDADYARSRGFKNIIAQPGMLICTLTLPYRWPWPEGYQSRRLIHFQLKEFLELPVGILSNYEAHFFRPIEIGDRINTTTRLMSISDWKRTRLGEGYFTMIETNYFNQRKELLCRAHTTLFSYGGTVTRGEADAENATAAKSKRVAPSTLEDQAPQEPPTSDAITGGWHNGTEECLESWRTGYQPKPPAELYFEDIEVGDTLPELVMPITVTRCSFMASASRDFAPQHHNTWYAHNKSKAREMFLGTHFNMGMMSRFMTDWGGPLSTVRRIQFRMFRTIGAGEDYMMSGKVIKKYEKNEEQLVDLEITIETDRGPAYAASGTLALPSNK